MRLVGAVLVAIGIAIGAWVLWPRSKSESTSASTSTSTSASTSTSTPAAGAPTSAKPSRVKKLATPEERQRVADRIAAAHASRSAESARTPAPKLPESADDAPPALSKESIRDAMHDVQAQLLACYEAALPHLDRKDFGVKAEMTLTGDPDVGTLIDAKQLIDDQGKPLDAKLDDCLRSTFQTLELPPLNEGDEVRVKYPFVFSHGD